MGTIAMHWNYTAVLNCSNVSWNAFVPQIAVCQAIPGKSGQ